MFLQQKNRKKLSVKLLLVSLLVLVSLFAVLGISCQQEKTPPSSIPVTTGWKADGVISGGEYLGAVRYGDFEIHWNSDGEFIYAGIKARTEGHVAVGFKPTTKMLDADMVFGFVKDGEVSIFDMFADAVVGSHPPDTELGGSNDILEFGGSEEGGFTTIEFKRALNTGDEYDKELTEGVNKIIWSYGGTDEVSQRHTSRGSGEITL